MRLPNLSQQELCDRIFLIVQTADRPLLRREICELLGRKKVPHITRMIEHLTNSGYFVRDVRTDAQWGKGYVYSIAGKSDGKQCENTDAA